MVTGDNNLFPYRSSWYITKFFSRCGFPFKHSKETRRIWVYDRLVELNVGNSTSNQDLPSADLVRVISQTFDFDEFEAAQKELQPALDDMNRLLKRSGLAVYLDASQRCHLKNTGSGVNSSVLSNQPRPLSQEEIAQRQRLTKFLDSASEDEFTQRLLVPFFQRLGFHRVSAAGHKEKTLEFGKDLWMKFQIPTGHWV